ncbi:hypothetical protein BEN48_13150 [Hymenobacter glacialis]|uniref:Uncharacterized protein n=1 Tax=Hymenobacter glacialis TaxID=1908236 RepID=A0A1G1T6B3_9BACT|nr:hypothetical protein BEN48_13150 [Hymenobacter glacialis]
MAVLAVVSSSCKKEYDDNSLAPLDLAFAPIPVTVTNASFFERYYIVVATAPSGAFSINFSIPADKGKIKEISRVAVGGSGLNNVQVGAPTVLYNYNGLTGSSAGATPIPGNGSNTVTFSSTLAAYTTYRTRVGTGVAPTSPTVSVTPQSPNQIEFYFLITLEDGTTIIPPRVLVRVV